MQDELKRQQEEEKKQAEMELAQKAKGKRAESFKKIERKGR